ncbi:MAG: hypothetical protein ACLU93_01015 [Streptococcus sp.]
MLVLKEVDVDWRGAGGAAAQGAIGGAIAGAFGGNVVLPVVGSVPGWVGGGALGGVGGTVAYGSNLLVELIYGIFYYRFCCCFVR